MRLATLIRPARDTTDVEPVDPARAEHERQVRQARLELARRRPTWTEIAETRLVRRGRFLVDQETDLIYVLRRGVVWEPHNATVGYIVDNMPMTFYVGQDDEVVFLEHPAGPRTWSEIVQRQAARK